MFVWPKLSEIVKLRILKFMLQMDPYRSISFYSKLLLEKCFYGIWLLLEIYEPSGFDSYLFSSVIEKQIEWGMGQTTGATLEEIVGKWSSEDNPTP